MRCHVGWERGGKWRETDLARRVARAHHGCGEVADGQGLAAMVENVDVQGAQLMVRAQAVQGFPQRPLQQRQALDDRLAPEQIHLHVRQEDVRQGLEGFAVHGQRVERGRVADPGQVVLLRTMVRKVKVLGQLPGPDGRSEVRHVFEPSATHPRAVLGCGLGFTMLNLRLGRGQVSPMMALRLWCGNVSITMDQRPIEWEGICPKEEESEEDGNSGGIHDD